MLFRVFPARSRYYNIGLNLGLSFGTLEAIKHDQRDQSDPCLRYVLDNWLKGNHDGPDASWKALANALKAPNVGVVVTISP